MLAVFDDKKQEVAEKPVKSNRMYFKEELATQSKYLKYFIDLRGVQIKDLASDIGVNRVTLANWCDGKSTLDEQHMQGYVIAWTLILSACAMAFRTIRMMA
jgi:hypothetical protein